MRVEVTWGDGPDILLVNEKYGTAGYMEDLTLEQAKTLKVKLEMAIAKVEDLEQLCKQNDDAMREQGLL